MTGIKEKDVELDILQDGDTAFKDTELYILQDIPQKLQGLTQLKTNYEFKEPAFEFEASADAVVYLGILKADVALISDMEPAGIQITVLRIAKDAKKDKECKIKAHEALLFTVFKKKFPKG